MPATTVNAVLTRHLDALSAAVLADRMAERGEYELEQEYRTLFSLMGTCPWLEKEANTVQGLGFLLGRLWKSKPYYSERARYNYVLRIMAGDREGRFTDGTMCCLMTPKERAAVARRTRHGLPSRRIHEVWAGPGGESLCLEAAEEVRTSGGKPVASVRFGGTVIGPRHIRADLYGFLARRYPAARWTAREDPFAPLTLVEGGRVVACVAGLTSVK